MTTNEKYLLIPKDIICYNQVEVGLMMGTTGGVVNEETAIYDYQKKPRTNLITFTEDGYRVKIDLISLSKTRINKLRKGFRIHLSEFQIAFEVHIKKINGTDNMRTFHRLQTKINKFLVFSTILANREIRLIHYQYGRMSRNGDGGQGAFMPYSFMRFTTDIRRVNTYYDGSFEKVIYHQNGLCVLNDDQIANLKVYLDKCLVQGIPAVKEPTIELFIHTHQYNWVKTGFFYSAVISLFSCFESLLSRTVRRTMFDADTLLSDFQNLRIAIAHLDDANIQINNNQYNVTKYRNAGGTTLTPPLQTTFNIDQLEDVRLKLIDEILARI